MQDTYSDFQIGNWVIYIPENNYCKIKFLSSIIELEGVLQTYHCTIENLHKIEITEDRLQVCGFAVDHRTFTKISNGKIFVRLSRSSPRSYSVYKNDEIYCEVHFIHEVQNAYYEITGELLKGNLYGVREN